jgi:hypothetical protein
MITIVSCQINIKNASIFKDTQWFLGEQLVFDNDSSVCFTEYDTVNSKHINRKTFPIYLTDSTLVYTSYPKRGYFNEDKDFVITHLEKHVDTVKYDLKYINKQPKLILYTNPFPIILTTNRDFNFQETNNFRSVKFTIANYSIGDLIDKSLLKTRGVYNYPQYTIEDCEYVENKDITYKIIGYNTIYSIERKRIEDYMVKEIIKVVTNKLGVSPEYRPMRKWLDGSDYEYEFYRWTANGVQINLSRSKYVGVDSYKTLVGDNEWTLSYDDSFTQALLIATYRNGKSSNSIIN